MNLPFNLYAEISEYYKYVLVGFAEEKEACRGFCQGIVNLGEDGEIRKVDIPHIRVGPDTGY